MLKLNKQRSRRTWRILTIALAVLLMGGGLYMLALTAAPAVAPILVTKPIDIKTLPAPTITENRVIIPKIGVNIAYGKGAVALDRGAEWRSQSSGTPADGGNFVIAAHRFSIQPTPMGTIEKSPFYNIDKLQNGDKVIIDYSGKRYGYEIYKEFNVHPTQIEIEARTNDPILTLYSCGLDGAEGDRYVLQAKRLGELALN